VIPALGPWLVALSTASFEACAPGPAPEPVCQVFAGLRPGVPADYSVAGATGTAAALPASGPLRFAVLGDSGTGSKAQWDVARRLDAAAPHFVLHTGDVVYPRGGLEDYGPKYFAPYKETLSRAPVYPAAGNHDYADARLFTERGRRRIETYKRIHRKPLYYSFDLGPAHFVSLDVNAAWGVKAAPAIGPGSPQHAWLERDLAASRAPWKILFLHVPVHASEDHGDHESLRAWLEPLLERHRVQLVLQGHDHIYERSRPIKGTTFITVGSSGAGLHPRRDRPDDPRFVARLALHGLLLGELEKDELRLSFLDVDGVTRDSAVLKP
jgi:acid phosphatase type 7